MANSIKFGNGQWATKKDSILAYNDENANFKPLPFVTSRASTATRVNKLGLIETVASGIPRVDYLGNTKGALLLEPQSTNLITQSEAFGNSYWTKSGASVVGGFASPSVSSPLGAFKLVEDTSTGGHRFFNLSIVSSGIVTLSVNLKASERNWVSLREGYSASETWFNLSSGTIGTETNVIDSKIEALSDGWYKCSITVTLPASLAFFGVYLADADNSQSYLGNGTSGVYIFGAQLEQSSYATSYIPTAGSAITRLADTASQTVPDGVIGQTEGVLYFESNVFSLSGDKAISLSSGSYNDSVSIGVYGGVFQSRIRQGGAFKHFISPSGINLLNNNKIAIMYSQSNIKIFVNGSLKSTVSGVTYAINLNKVNFTRADNTDKYYGLIKDLKVYNTALTDQELAALTQV